MLEVKTFPKDMSVFEVNRSDAKECFLSGLFEESVKLENETRRFYTYLKPGLHYNQPCLIVAPPSCDSVLDWLEESFWLSFAEEHDLFLLIILRRIGLKQVRAYPMMHHIHLMQQIDDASDIVFICFSDHISLSFQITWVKGR